MALVKLLKLNSAGKRPRQHDSSADELLMLTLQGGNLKMSGNTLSSEDTDGNVVVNPNGTGLISFYSAYTFPDADGSADQILQTDGAGALSFVDLEVDDTKKLCFDTVADGIIADRNVVYISGSNTVEVADNAVSGKERGIGFAVNGAADLAAVKVCTDGLIDGFSALTPAAEYFLDSAGAITAAPANDDDDGLLFVGVALTATSIVADFDFITEIETG